MRAERYWPFASFRCYPITIIEKEEMMLLPVLNVYEYRRKCQHHLVKKEDPLRPKALKKKVRKVCEKTH